MPTHEKYLLEGKSDPDSTFNLILLGLAGGLGLESSSIS